MSRQKHNKRTNVCGSLCGNGDGESGVVHAWGGSDGNRQMAMDVSSPPLHHLHLHLHYHSTMTNNHSFIHSLYCFVLSCSLHETPNLRQSSSAASRLSANAAPNTPHVCFFCKCKRPAFHDRCVVAVVRIKFRCSTPVSSIVEVAASEASPIGIMLWLELLLPAEDRGCCLGSGDGDGDVDGDSGGGGGGAQELPIAAFAVAAQRIVDCW